MKGVHLVCLDDALQGQVARQTNVGAVLHEGVCLIMKACRQIGHVVAGTYEFDARSTTPYAVRKLW